MRFQPSRLPLWVGKRFHSLPKPFMWLWGQYYGYSRKTPHWVFTAMGDAMNYRVPYWVKLDGNLRLKVIINELTGQEICQHGYTESASVDLISRFLRPGSVFFDLGAHVGQYTVIAARLVGAQGAVHSFEPDAETFRWMCENVCKNQLSNVVTNQVAMWKEAGYLDFHLATVSTLAASSLTNPKEPSGQVVRIPTVSLSEYCRLRGIEKIDFMKIDVEGAEIETLRGAAPFLSRKEKPAIHIEFHPYTQKAAGHSLTELAQVLLEYDYVLFRLTEQGPQKFWLECNEPTVFNVLALSGSDAVAFRG